MAIDKRGDLWIIQRGNDFPIVDIPVAKYMATIKCFTTNGIFTGRDAVRTLAEARMPR